MKPIRLEIVTKVLTFFGQCRRCEIVYDQVELGKKSRQKRWKSTLGLKGGVREALGMDPGINPAL